MRRDVDRGGFLEMPRSRIIIAVVALACMVGGMSLAYSGPDLSNNEALVGDDLQLAPGLEMTDEMARWIESVRGEAGVYVRKFGGYNLVVVARGGKPNAGYRVVLEDISLLDVVPPAPGSGISAPPPNRWFVSVKLVDPAPGDVLAQVISYPCLAVALADNGAVITVQEVSGDSPVNLPVVIAK
jgi:hypothetical protein